MAEFLVQLLHSCPSSSRTLRGKETPVLRCVHCSYSRGLAEENFLSMQLPLVEMTSVQQALNAYLQSATVHDDIAEWCCLNERCLDAGRAQDPPRLGLRIDLWPDTLMLFLNRWDSLHGLLRQAVLCENILIAGENIYELQAVITHIGDLPSRGHYVAYARDGDCFVKFDDSRVSRTAAGHHNFSSSPNEKVYVLTYVKKQPTEAAAAPEVIALERPRPKFPRLASRSGHIDLDSSEDDSAMVKDFDVIVQIHASDSKESGRSRPPMPTTARRTTSTRTTSSTSHSTGRRTC